MRRAAGKVLVAVGAVLVVTIVGAAAAVIVVTSDGGSSGGGCFPTLAEHLPEEPIVVRGSDNDRAQAAGIALDGPVEDLSSEVLDTGFQPDPLTNQTVFQFLDDAGKVGYRMTDLDCWLGDVTPDFAARGDVDADTLASGLAGQDDRAVLDGDLLAYSPDGDADELIDPTEASSALVALLDEVDERGALTFSGLLTGDDQDDPWVALGLADGEGDGFDLVAVWAFADAEEIDDDVRTAVVEAIGDGSVAELIDGDADDLLEINGSTLSLRAPLAGQTQSWVEPMRQLDPVFTAVGPDADLDADQDED
jgi:hypothetical protein